MIDVLLAQTREVDDVEAALREVLALLNLGQRLKKNSVGLLSCANAFLESGAVKAICERLPFPVVGINSLLNSTSLGALDAALLSLAVLTSDEIHFAAGLSEPLEPECRGAVIDAYLETERLLASRPALAIVQAPALASIAVGEKIARVFDEVSDSVPLFGSQAADYSTYLRAPQVIYNGEAFSDCLAMVLIEGRVQPRFDVFPVSPHKAIHQKAIVTASQGNVLMEVNGVPVLEYMESLGLCWYGHISGTHCIPIFLDRGDGNPPTARTIHSQTPEGHIVLCGDAPIDTTLGIGSLSPEDVLSTAAAVGQKAKFLRPNALVMYSCLSRNIALGLDYMAEIETLQRHLEGCVPYLFSYSSGEFCPVTRQDGRSHNEYHNMSLVTLSL
ncbi:MAG: FIST C-terminal domain-containing protein [Deltaproteobacteria bacterium]|jgi:hypothetical protein|nr:FIST C-terminal domain-containing protein [Deltaproteobacteria bacterium]